jgi:mRNA interferase MazF
VAARYVPDRGDLVWLDFDPQLGHEQRGTRPALVLSPRAYNSKVGLAVCCPVTSHTKGYPFEVAVPTGLLVTGVILADHVKNLDWKARRARFACALPRDSVDEAARKLAALVGLEEFK